MLVERPIVAKFGGSSMADADTIRRVADIIRSDADRRVVVVSAPGVNHQYGRKVTNLLEIASIFEGHVDYDETESKIALEEFSERFLAIGKGLGCNQVDSWIQEVREGVFPGNMEWSMSRGEWLMARVFASYLGATFIDAEEIIRLEAGRVDTSSFELVRARLGRESGICVIPGFYGLEGMRVGTFPRGGSDITGAIIARGVRARIYENWTDVNGVLAANPKVVAEPRTIESITYEEMRELGNRGANVLQRDTILPLVEAGIPINVRNTFNPDTPGTMIQARRPFVAGESVIGIAGEGGFMSFNIRKFGMNDEIGIGTRILGCFRNAGISYEHSPSGRDYMSVIVKQNQSSKFSEEFVFKWLVDEAQPDNIGIQRNLGLLSVVGQSISDQAVTMSRILFSALDDAAIPVRAFSFGAPGISMVVAVDEDKIEDAQRVAYKRFIAD